MSALDERRPLTSRPSPPSLHSYARARLDAEPDGRWPEGCYPPPERALPPDDAGASDRAAPLRHREAVAAVQEALGPLLGSPGPAPGDDLGTTAGLVRHRLAGLPVTGRSVAAAVADLPLPDEPAARALGRHLVRTAPDLASAHVGVALLQRVGEPADVPSLRVLGLVRGLTRGAVRALERLDARAAALLHLTCHTERPGLRVLADACASGDPRAAAAALIDDPLGIDAVSPTQARLLAEAADLAGLLRGGRVDPRLSVQAGRLLVRMASQRDYRTELLRYRDAVEVFDTVVRRACGLPPTVERAAVLLSLALDLDSGPSHLLPWRAGQREQLLDALGALLTSPEWAALPDRADGSAPPGERHRAAWLRGAAERLPAPRQAPPGRLRIEVVAHDPVDREPVETRFLIDGRPLVPEVFGRGPGHSPEYLLDSGDLAATEEPREVQLAEAWCSEGCCGALGVTVVREGGEVVWRDWRLPARLPDGSPAPSLPAYRFDAAAYDAELARAVREDGWSWPARDTGRLLSSGLRARPELLARWDARPLHAGVDTRDPYTTVLWFLYRPGIFEGEDDERGPWLPFVWRLPDDGAEPHERAAAALRRLAEEDPRGYAECRGGGR
ncbi:hypothetical protein [Streptomyces sp. NBC_01268]|uniref:hypothetical protein n=1 Tax=Streptomyces sp. NBC_01268 TaxID=2903806 RepID=UPI002E328987|nr:hypothetical protein [Streptomyces sp. NBC_01268]